MPTTRERVLAAIDTLDEDQLEEILQTLQRLSGQAIDNETASETCLDLARLQTSVAEENQAPVPLAASGSLFALGLQEDPTGVAFHAMGDLIHGWADCPDPAHRVAMSSAPADAFVMVLPVDLLDAWMLGDAYPFRAGCPVLFQRCAPDHLDPASATLLLQGRNGRFRATGEPWSVGFPCLVQRPHQEPEVRITYRSAAAHARPSGKTQCPGAVAGGPP